MRRVIVCPHCKEPSFTVWQKQALAPRRQKRCRRCGAMVSIGWVHWLPQLLLAAAFPVVVVYSFLETGILGGVGVILLMVLASGLYQHYVAQLVVRSTPD